MDFGFDGIPATSIPRPSEGFSGNDGRPNFQDTDSDNDGILDGSDSTLDDPDACCEKLFRLTLISVILLLLILIVLLWPKRHLKKA